MEPDTLPSSDQVEPNRLENYVETPSVNPDLSSQIEMQVPGVDKSEDIHMRRIRERYKDQLGSFEIIPIDDNGENLGYVLRNSDNPHLEGDWILSDLDDTLIGTQEVKP